MSGVEPKAPVAYASPGVLQFPPWRRWGQASAGGGSDSCQAGPVKQGGHVRQEAQEGWSLGSKRWRFRCAICTCLMQHTCMWGFLGAKCSVQTIMLLSSLAVGFRRASAGGLASPMFERACFISVTQIQPEHWCSILLVASNNVMGCCACTNVVCMLSSSCVEPNRGCVSIPSSQSITCSSKLCNDMHQPSALLKSQTLPTLHLPLSMWKFVAPNACGC